MATLPKILGYLYRQELNKAQRAEKRAFKFVTALLDERPSAAITALYLAEILRSLHDMKDAHAALGVIITSEEASQAPRFDLEPDRAHNGGLDEQ